MPIWTYVAEGSSNVAWGRKDQKDTILKAPKIKERVALDRPVRAVRVFNELNDEIKLKAASVFSISSEDQFVAREGIELPRLQQQVWLAPRIYGKLPSRLKIAEAIFKIYIKTRRLIRDAYVRKNFIEMEDGTVICIDPGFALRRGSEASRAMVCKWEQQQLTRNYRVWASGDTLGEALEDNDFLAVLVSNLFYLDGLEWFQGDKKQQRAQLTLNTVLLLSYHRTTHRKFKTWRNPVIKEGYLTEQEFKDFMYLASKTRPILGALVCPDLSAAVVTSLKHLKEKYRSVRLEKIPNKFLNVFFLCCFHFFKKHGISFSEKEKSILLLSRFFMSSKSNFSKEELEAITGNIAYFSRFIFLLNLEGQEIMTRYFFLALTGFRVKEHKITKKVVGLILELLDDLNKEALLSDVHFLYSTDIFLHLYNIKSKVKSFGMKTPYKKLIDDIFLSMLREFKCKKHYYLMYPKELSKKIDPIILTLQGVIKSKSSIANYLNFFLLPGVKVSLFDCVLALSLDCFIDNMHYLCRQMNISQLEEMPNEYRSPYLIAALTQWRISRKRLDFKRDSHLKMILIFFKKAKRNFSELEYKTIIKNIGYLFKSDLLIEEKYLSSGILFSLSCLIINQQKITKDTIKILYQITPKGDTVDLCQFYSTENISGIMEAKKQLDLYLHTKWHDDALAVWNKFLVRNNSNVYHDVAAAKNFLIYGLKQIHAKNLISVLERISLAINRYREARVSRGSSCFRKLKQCFGGTSYKKVEAAKFIIKKLSGWIKKLQNDPDSRKEVFLQAKTLLSNSKAQFNTSSAGSLCCQYKGKKKVSFKKVFGKQLMVLEGYERTTNLEAKRFRRS